MKLTVEGSLGYSQKAIEIVRVVVGFLANHSAAEFKRFKWSILKHRTNNKIYFVIYTVALLDRHALLVHLVGVQLDII